jgi:hypothetical protein
MADAIVGSVAVEVVPSTRTWNAKLRADLLPQADKLGNDIGDRIGRNAQQKFRERMAKLPDAKVGVNIKQADAELARFRKNASKDATMAIKVNSRGLAGYRTQIAAATRDRTQKIHVEADTSQLDKVLQKFSKLSLGGGAAKGIGIAALVPALSGLATAAPILGGLTAGLTTAGLGTAAFATVAVPSFKKVETAAQGLSKAQLQLKQARAAGTSPAILKAQQSLAKAEVAQGKAAKGSAKQQATAAATVLSARQRLAAAEKNSPVNKALLKQKQILDELDPAQRNAVKQYQAFTGAITDFQKKSEPQVFGTIGGGFKLLTSQLPKLTPLVQGAAGAFTELETDAGKALNSPFWKNFDEFVTKRGPQSIQAYGKIAGNTVTGLFGIIQGFDPQIKTTQDGLLGLTRKFSQFGQDAASGKSKSFTQFTEFAHKTAPQVKKDLGDIGKLAGNTVVGLSPSVGPSLKLIDDVVKGVSPLIAPLEAKLPGIIGNLDEMVQKVSPLAEKLSGPFSEGVATTIKDVAGAIGDVAGWLDKIPEPVLKNIGEDIGVLVAAATIAKITGLTKLPGILKGIYNAFPRKGSKDPLDGMGGKFKNMGDKAGGAAGDLDKFAGAKGREKTAMKGNDDLLDANARGFKNMGDEAETAGKKLGRLPGLAKGFFGLAAGASIPAFNILANDDTSLGVKSAKKNLDTVKNKTVKITANDLLQPQVRAANKLLDGVHNKKVDLSARNRTGPAVHSANSTVAQFHGKTVNLTASGLTGVRNTYKQAQGTVDSFHGKTVNLTASGLTGIRNTYSQAQGIVNQFHGKSVDLTANNGGIRRAVSNAQSLINSLHGKNVTNTVTTNYVEHHSGGGKSNGNSKGLFGKGSDLKQGKKQDVFKLPLPYLNRVPSYAREFELVGATGGKAATGKLRGPGTPTSDSIPSMLSTDEWVIKAGRARQLGDNFMNWVNYGSGLNPPGFLRMYRDGGPVRHLASGGPAKLETESAYKRGIRGTGVKHTAAEWQRIEAAKAPQYIYETTAATRTAAAKQRSRLQAAGEKVFSSILSGFGGSASTSKIASTANAVISKIDSAFTGGRRSSLVKFVQKENRDLTRLAKERDAISTRLQAYTSARSAARSQALDFANIGTLPSGLGPGDIIAGKRLKLSGLRSFTSNLKALAKRGLSTTEINEIIGLGPEQGGIYASELMHATSGQIKQLNSLERGIGSAAKTYGIAAANSQVGGNIAKDFVAGLVSREGRLSDAMTRAARAFAKQLQRDFDRKASAVKAKTVKVKVTKHDTGGYLPEGLSVNLNETGRPEPVLTPSEEKTFRSIAANNAGWAGKASQSILPGANITINSDSDADGLGQRLALILRAQL